jgi:hypothetical protein
MTLRFQVRSTQWFSYLTELSTCKVFHTVHRAGHSKKVVEERIALVPRDPVPRSIQHLSPHWLAAQVETCPSFCLTRDASQTHPLNAMGFLLFTHGACRSSPLGTTGPDPRMNTDANVPEANKTATGKSAMAIGKAIRSQINHRRSSSLQLSNRSARRLQAVCVKLSQAQPQPHKVSLSYKGHGIHNY